jgi:hypothetical protein
MNDCPLQKEVERPFPEYVEGKTAVLSKILLFQAMSVGVRVDFVSKLRQISRMSVWQSSSKEQQPTKKEYSTVERNWRLSHVAGRGFLFFLLKIPGQKQYLVD